ncbi:zinc finger protein 184-like [Anopheles maculipalpis]|uniref:zinc finger protein 184-like n=1 Tax=Anopheles maculipalpis TaxID=1496333 RepID=UPI002158C54C|nr:zinc finger protein 184-like [Anopheles maculipalpis]
MGEKCRLCLKKIIRKRTTILQDKFRKMMDAVFSFSFVKLEELSVNVCSRCSSTVRNFFSYSQKVEKNQRLLEQKYLKSDCTSDIAQSRVFVNGSLHYDLYYNEDGTDDSISMDAEKFLLQRDPLSEVSSIDYSTKETELESKTLNHSHKASSPDDAQSSNLSYSCDECELKFATKIQQYKHRRMHQKKECLVCNKRFRTDKIKDHVARKHPKIFEKLVQECKELRCENCQELFNTEAELNDHLDVDETKILCSGGTNNARLYYCTKRYKCCNCEEKFFDKLELTKHQRRHRTVECPTCSKTVRSDKIKKHIASQHPTRDSTELFKCVECRKLFNNEAELTAHRKATHNKQVCPVCKKTANYAHIRRHLKWFNSVYSPDDSDEFSDNMVNMSKKIKTENFQCEECGQTFPHDNLLHKHQRVHGRKKCSATVAVRRGETLDKDE